jgi:hypothetical protein
MRLLLFILLVVVGCQAQRPVGGVDCDYPTAFKDNPAAYHPDPGLNGEYSGQGVSR